MEQNDHMRGQKISEIIENLYHIFLSHGQTVNTFTFQAFFLFSKVPLITLEDMFR